MCLRPLATDALQYYELAHAEYVEAHAPGLLTTQRQDHLEMVGRQLNAAIGASQAQDGSEYACPLFRSRLGELLLVERSAEGYDRAARLFHDAVDETKGSKAWVPGWLGLAARASATSPSEPREAEQYIHNAEIALDVLLEHTADSKLDDQQIFQRARPDSHDRTSPDLERADQIALLWQWLYLNEAWHDPTTGRATGAVSGQSGTRASTGHLERRLRARIAFERSRLEDAQGKPSTVVLTHLDRASQWDPDFIPARLATARQLRKQGKFREAQEWLWTFVHADSSPIYRNNPELWFELACIYSRWYDQDPSDELAQRAEESFWQLLTIQEDHGPGWFEFGRFWLESARRYRSDASQWHTRLTNAQTAADSALKCGVLPREAERLSEAIHAEHRARSTATSAGS